MKQILKSGPGIVIGIPTLGRPVPLDWALSFKSLSPPMNFNTILQITRGREIGAARCDMAQHALEQGTKYLFFLGDDVVVPSHTLRQLIYRMEQDASIGVVGGVYCSKCDPAAPLVFKGNGSGSYWDWKIGELFEVTGLGMDCTLIRTELLTQLSKPYFKSVDEDQYLDGKNSQEAWTEDLYFCKKVLEETEYKIMCDASVICEHWDVYANKMYKLPKDSLPMRQRTLRKDCKRLLVIGPPIQLADFVLEDYDVIRVNQDDLADYRGTYASLPFEEKQFDWVIVQNINTDYRNHLDEWKRVTKPGGKLSLDFDPIINLDAVQILLNADRNGDYLELNNVGLSVH